MITYNKNPQTSVCSHLCWLSIPYDAHNFSHIQEFMANLYITGNILDLLSAAGS